MLDNKGTGKAEAGGGVILEGIGVMPFIAGKKSFKDWKRVEKVTNNGWKELLSKMPLNDPDKNEQGRAWDSIQFTREAYRRGLINEQLYDDAIRGAIAEYIAHAIDGMFKEYFKRILT